MNENTTLDNTNSDTDTELLEKTETEMTEQEETGQTDVEQTDAESETDVSATESLTVADTPATECLFNDTNICDKLDIIIMLLIVIIAIRMFSPLANNHKKMIERKDK